jgi:hypothetical protein
MCKSAAMNGRVALLEGPVDQFLSGNVGLGVGGWRRGLGLQPRVKQRDELCLFSCLFPFASETAVQNVQQLKCTGGSNPPEWRAMA